MRITTSRLLILSLGLLLSALFIPKTYAYTYCGFGETYDYLTETCKCSYGYVRTYSGCITEDQYCKNIYGYGARANYAGNCECTSGYVMIGNKCEMGSIYCSNKYGSGATYDSLSSSCKCRSSYIMTGGRCELGSTYCSNKYGFNADYDSLSDSCKCRTGYVFNATGTKCISLDDRCVEIHGYGSESSSTYYNDFKGMECECKNTYMMVGNKCEVGSTYCSNTYGSHSDFDFSSQSCVCSSGYTLNSSGNNCISLDEKCQEDFGSWSEAASSYYNGLGKLECKCQQGYLYNEGETECVDADLRCEELLGDNAVYDDSSEECVCDSGYVFDQSSEGCMEESIYCETYFGEYTEYSGNKECECISGYKEDDYGACKEYHFPAVIASSIGSGVGRVLLILTLLSTGLVVIVWLVRRLKK